ncbi:MAG: hypothetical protein ACD_46C00103G0004 [uncultured bacterium]|nr:MAG: hypothetical protein ACD_46C00103G0004 [uncultured bacterium]
MKLGNKEFPINIIQGPLAGISCAPFRRLTWQYGKPAFACTEMISCKTLIYQNVMASRRYLMKDPQEGPVCFQLSGNNPIELAEAVKRVTDAGADLIDLNCGCPVKKIRVKGAGSSLLTSPQLLYQLITAMKTNTSVPVSIKIRVEKSDSEKFNREIVNVITEAGTDFVIVHGRHWTEHYETSCRYDQIEYFVNELKVPVIGNGDIACVQSLKKMLATGCAGVMIARAGVGQPWLINQLTMEMKGKTFLKPTLKERHLILLKHVAGLIDLLGEEKFAILQARKFAKYYARDVIWRSDFCAEINNCDKVNELEKICERYFI